MTMSIIRANPTAREAVLKFFGDTITKNHSREKIQVIFKNIYLIIEFNFLFYFNFILFIYLFLFLLYLILFYHYRIILINFLINKFNID